MEFEARDSLWLQLALDRARRLGCRLVGRLAVRWRCEVAAPVIAERS